MKYTLKNLPAALNGLPDQGKSLWLSAVNGAIDSGKDEAESIVLARAAVDEKFEQDEKGTWRAKQEVSLDQIRDMLYEAVRDKYGKEDSWLMEVYPGHLIYQKDGKTFKVSWSMMDGEAKIGDQSVEVSREWIELRSTQAESDEEIDMLARLGESKNVEGSEWEVTIIKPGISKTGWYFSDDLLRASADMFEGADVNLYDLPQGVTHVPDQYFFTKDNLIRNKTGWIDKVRFVAGEGLKGVLHFLDSFKWIGKNMLAAKQSGVNVYGLSIDYPVRAKEDIVNGKKVINVLKFKDRGTVDIVARPAAGGKFNRAIASMPAQNNREDLMDKKQIWDMIHASRPDLLMGKNFDAISDQEIQTLARMAMTPEKKDQPDAVELLRCEMSLDRKLSKCGLPDIAQERIRKQFTGKVFGDDDLDAAITGEKDYIAKMSQPASEPEGVPSRTVIVVGMDSFARARMAVDRMFGLTKDDMTAMAKLQTLDNQPYFDDIRSVQDVQDFDQVPVFSGLREMYTFFTGDTGITGRVNLKNIPKDIRAKMDITTGTFTYVLGNTLGRRLVKVYNENDFGEGMLVSVRKPVKDYRPQEAVMIGGFGDIDTVDPEAADYQEVGAVTDEESTYSVGTKGNILTITEKTIRNDDISVVQRLVNALGKAARRTHAKYIINLAISNANCSDGTAIFTVPHGNLGTAALSFEAALAAWKALAGMTEKDSGEPLGLLDGGVKANLIYPVGLVETAESIVNDDEYFSANDLTTKTRNPLKGKINGKMISLLTDANDWYMSLPPDVADLIEMGYMDGRQEPEFFLADSPQSEQVFVADKIRYKLRHRYAGAWIDYRGAYKAVVAP